MTEIEEWRPIEGYEGLYQVSNLGRVKSIGYGKERILKPVIDKDGYPMVNLYREGKRKTVRVHRLVGITFIPNPDNLPVINHKNEIKTDSRRRTSNGPQSRGIPVTGPVLNIWYGLR